MRPCPCCGTIGVKCKCAGDTKPWLAESSSKVWLEEIAGRATTAHVPMDAEVVIACGGDTNIRIEKLYGPLVACDVRVRVDVPKAEWVVERLREPIEGDATWEEMARFGCQDSIEFSK